MDRSILQSFGLYGSCVVERTRVPFPFCFKDAFKPKSPPCFFLKSWSMEIITTKRVPLFLPGHCPSKWSIIWRLHMFQMGWEKTTNYSQYIAHDDRHRVSTFGVATSAAPLGHPEVPKRIRRHEVIWCNIAGVWNNYNDSVHIGSFRYSMV